MSDKQIHPKKWRNYQKRLKREARVNSFFRKAPRFGVYGVASFLMLAVVCYAGSWLLANWGDTPRPKEDLPELPQVTLWDKKDLPAVLNQVDLVFPKKEPGLYSLEKEGKTYTIELSIDGDLQNFSTKLLRRSLTHQAAVVVMRPETGQVLALVNFQNGAPEQAGNLCLKADYPAASLFKIVSAAAAIEARDFTPDKPLAYRGRRYTLYKSQLKKGTGRYTTKVTFERAFSKSINPVFGKIGIYDLGRELLYEYAGKFLFNLHIPFDLPLAASNIQVPEDDFGLAEIASGFNKETLISPLHAALITAAVANGGTVMEPWLVKHVRDESNNIVYSANPSRLSKVIEEGTAKNLKTLMAETVLTGTCRKAFRSLRRKKIFKGVELGAKTGTINDRSDRYKIDWLSAYALSDKNKNGICVAILAVHGKKLGIRAKDLGREIINHYFSS